MAVVKQKSMVAFGAMCVALSLGILAAQAAEDISVFAPSPKDGARAYTAKARVEGGQPPVTATRLVVAGSVLKMGDSAQVEFSTDGDGVGRVPLALARPEAEEGRPIMLVSAMGSSNIAWSGTEVHFGGLRPNARYRAQAAMWLWGGLSSEPDTVQKRVMSKGVENMECHESCVAAFGKPALMGLESGPAWRQAEVKALGSTLWGAPMLLALAGLAWRRGGRPAVRKALVAAGVPTGLPLAVKAPRVG